MRQEMFQRIWDDGTKVIEFYGRTMEWHRAWADEFRWMYHLNVVRWPWLAKLRAVAKTTRRPRLSVPE
jgi:hypothetical protein